MPSEDSWKVRFRIAARIIIVGWHGFVISYCVSDKFSVLTVGAGIPIMDRNSALGSRSPQ